MTYPPGWNEERVRRLTAEYDAQTDDHWTAEDEAAFESRTETTMIVPTELVPAIRALIARQQRGHSDD